MSIQPRSFARRLSRRRLIHTATTTTAAVGAAALLACGSVPRRAGLRLPHPAPINRRSAAALYWASTNKFDAALDPHPIQPVYTSFYTLGTRPFCV